MLTTKTRIIIKYARFFEVSCLLFAAGNFINIVVDVYFLFFRENWLIGEFRRVYILMLQLSILSFIIGYIAKIGFSVIREFSNKGRLS